MTEEAEPPQAQWQEPPMSHDATNFRSVTPAMNNRRNPSPAPVRGPSPSAAARMEASKMEAHYAGRSPTPTRYVDGYTGPGGTPTRPDAPNNNGPSSTGLIRLALRKPMGIVFEPMYDPNAPSVQRGVRICDLPRTGAAALSRRLEVGDELLSINDKTMSRLTFDEIMDFIIEADPEQVNLLFRRPRKEILNARHGIKAPASGTNTTGVKWVDDEERKHEGDKRKSDRNEKKASSASRRSRPREDDDTLQSEDYESYRRSRRGGRRRHNPYESESFLDILIDTICANPDSVCRDRRRPNDDDTYYSEDDETFASRDDSTYVTYESEDTRQKKREKTTKKKKSLDDEDDDDSSNDEDRAEEKRKSKSKKKETRRPSPAREVQRKASSEKAKKYEDDNTLETVDSQERAKAAAMDPQPEPVPPLGLMPNPEPVKGNLPPAQDDTDNETNPAAPIRAVEFDEDADVGADVSVMESLGGPSLLIEKQRQAQIMGSSKPDNTPPVPPEISDNFGKDYPLDFGFTREQTIQNDPLRFYSFVVKGLLQEHEPEKVRLLDKLLAKYRGREDHLIQKLSVRYNTEEPEEEQFGEAVVKAKTSAHSRENVDVARERMQTEFQQKEEWPDKETKEPEAEDEAPADEDGEQGSEYSGDSIDGTSPAVIAQVSELLNYVYGKTSVPGQIDRVSTIMRAYEGREAVLLELLETKALIKANRDKENAGSLPSFLKNSQKNIDQDQFGGSTDAPPVTPMAMQPPAAINDDISSMGNVSPANGQQTVLKQIAVSRSEPRKRKSCCLFFV